MALNKKVVVCDGFGIATFKQDIDIELLISSGVGDNNWVILSRDFRWENGQRLTADEIEIIAKEVTGNGGVFIDTTDYLPEISHD